MITKIVTGGQTGADQGATEAAIHCRLAYGGWIPKGRKAERGSKVPTHHTAMTEHTSADYLTRTEANVIDSDATLVLTMGPLMGGSKRTVEFAQFHQRPVLHLEISTENRTLVTTQIIAWLRGETRTPAPPTPCILNVAGNRESQARGIHDLTRAVMIDVITALNTERPRHECGVSPLRSH